MRLTFHPSHWCKLASESADTVARAVESVTHHGRWLDLMELPRSPRYAINVHIGAHYGDKAATADRFCDVVTALPPRARERLTVADVPEWLCRESDVVIESHGKEASIFRVREAP